MRKTIAAISVIAGALAAGACNPLAPEPQRPGRVPQPKVEKNAEIKNQLETGRDQAGRPQNQWGSEQLRFDTTAGRNRDPKAIASPYPSQQNKGQ